MTKSSCSPRPRMAASAGSSASMPTTAPSGKKAPTHAKNTLASSTPATDGERVYVVFWDGSDVALHGFGIDGTPLWQRPLGKFKSQHGVGMSPMVCRDMVVVNNDQDGS